MQKKTGFLQKIRQKQAQDTEDQIDSRHRDGLETVQDPVDDASDDSDRGVDRDDVEIRPDLRNALFVFVSPELILLPRRVQTGKQKKDEQAFEDVGNDHVEGPGHRLVRQETSRNYDRDKKQMQEKHPLQESGLLFPAHVRHVDVAPVLVLVVFVQLEVVEKRIPVFPFLLFLPFHVPS